MFFIYVTIAVLVLSIAIINIQPFKKASVHYPSNDPIFMVLLSLVYVVLLGREIAFHKRPHA